MLNFDPRRTVRLAQLAPGTRSMVVRQSSSSAGRPSASVALPASDRIASARSSRAADSSWSRVVASRSGRTGGSSLRAGEGGGVPSFSDYDPVAATP